jgi:hypothetical protein
MDYQAGLKAILDSSTLLVNWALALFAGSAAAIVSTSFERPKKRLTRSVYLLFPAAWACLGWSLWAAQKISRHYVAAQLSPGPENVQRVLSKMNNAFLCQWQMLAAGLVFLSVWLCWFVVWWIWFAPEIIKKRESTYDVN